MHEHSITVTHLNIRQSIAILLAKLILTDILLSIVVIGFYFLLVQADNNLNQGVSQNSIIFLIVFGAIGLVKLIISSYIVLQWLNEYYEITPEAVIHKRGIVHKRSEKFSLDKIRAVRVEDTFLGEIFNYATVSLYDIRLNKYLDMYLIHHPDRYVNVLRRLRPHLEIKSDRIKIPFMPNREKVEEIED
jgi:hypothetical protein